MNSESLILAGVLGFCALVGVGVSHVVTPVVEPVVQSAVSIMGDESASGSSTAGAGETKIEYLRSALTAHYPNTDFTDETLENLRCGEEGFLGQKDCYGGATSETKRYGKANVMMDGKSVHVQLVTMPAGAFLVK